ncbi:MAG: response regulator transcription factor [Vampirovibrionales bacterium]
MTISKQIAGVRPRVLVVDDETDLVRLLRFNLEKEGYEVFCAYDGNQARDYAWSKQPDLVVLDLMLPDASGYDLCKEIKALINPKRPHQPVRIIMLTARSAELDRIQGFESGADDYVTKPFSPRELMLRVRVMLDRLGQVPATNVGSSTPTLSSNIMELPPIKMDLAAFRCWVNETELKLTPIEFRILSTLAKQPNHVKSREQLLSDVWEDEAMEVMDRTVDAHVKRLRSKLLEARELLETVRGVGYRLTIPAPTPVSL